MIMQQATNDDYYYDDDDADLILKKMKKTNAIESCILGLVSIFLLRPKIFKQ